MICHMANDRVEAINSKGCSRLFVGTFSASPSLKSFKSAEPMSSASTPISEPGTGAATGPFAGLVICVTGLSKEARKQVMAATERLGGLYSASLHPQCTHLVVQSFGGRKLEHALKHGLRNGLLVVTLGWFVDSVRRNVRLSESLYSVKNVGENGSLLGENHMAGYTGSEKSCLPVKLYEDNKSSSLIWQPHLHLSGKESRRNRESILADDCIYIDSNISTELKKKVVDVVSREGAVVLDHWFIGCQASHVVCEGPYIQNYIGHANNLVTPMWILKTLKEKYMQRLVHLSTDLARQVAMMLENVQDKNGQTANPVATNSRESLFKCKTTKFPEEREKIAKLAKMGVRNRRDRRMQFVRTPIRPINPSSLLDAVCWSISEPTSSASTYSDSSVNKDASELHASVFFDAQGDERDSEASFDNSTHPLRESEKREVIFKNHFLTILFPIDRFGELGPASKTFFSDGGFTCLQVLDYIYSFYQENMSLDEIDVAIHTDSRHADRLRSLYAFKEGSLVGESIPCKRIEFLGSRRSFEALKRVSGENNINVYELLIRA